MKKISYLLIFVGIIILCGAAGTSDFAGLSMRMIAEKILLGAIFMTSGYVLKYFNQIIPKKSVGHRCKIYRFPSYEEGLRSGQV